jgi:DNA primase
MHERVIFPLHENGVLVGYCGRTVLPVTQENPKWRLGKGTSKTMCFGIEKCDPTKQLVLLESPWEVLLARQMGRDAVALLGTVMSEGQEKQLEPFGTIWVMMDDDEAGKRASAEVCARLEKRHRIIRSFLKD